MKEIRNLDNHQAQLQRWQEKNRLSKQQSQLGEAKPLDDEDVLARLRNRLAKEELHE